MKQILLLSRRSEPTFLFIQENIQKKICVVIQMKTVQHKTYSESWRNGRIARDCDLKSDMVMSYLGFLLIYPKLGIGETLTLHTLMEVDK